MGQRLNHCQFSHDCARLSMLTVPSWEMIDRFTVLPLFVIILYT